MAGAHSSSSKPSSWLDVLSEKENLLSVPVLASQIDPRDPFVSYYTLKDAQPTQIGDTEVGEGDGVLSAPRKAEVIHVNFIRVAKVLVRRTYVDRERLAWLEYWLGVREEPLHIVDMPNQQFHNAAVKDSITPSDKNNMLTDIEELHNPRPDIRDVWDLVEDRVCSFSFN